jgi:hypothetical protein
MQQTEIFPYVIVFHPYLHEGINGVIIFCQNAQAFYYSFSFLSLNQLTRTPLFIVSDSVSKLSV